MTIEQRIRASLNNPANKSYQGLEADAIVEVMEANGCTRYVDVGCFHGGLARAVVARTPVRSVHLVEPVRELLMCAEHEILEEVPGMPVHMTNAAMVGNDRNSIEITVTTKSLSASGISEKCPFVGSRRIVEAVRVHDYLAMHFPHDELDDLFLKIDAEYLDLDIVSDLLAHNWLPKAFEFELIETKLYDEFLNTVLRPCSSYVFPDNLPIKSHRYFSIITSPTMYRVVGFEPFEVYVGGSHGMNMVPTDALSRSEWHDPRMNRFKKSS